MDGVQPKTEACLTVLTPLVSFGWLADVEELHVRTDLDHWAEEEFRSDQFVSIMCSF